MFRAFSAFNSHIYRHHRDLMGVDLCVSALSEASSSHRTPGVVTNVGNVVGQHDQLATESNSDDCSEPCQEYYYEDQSVNSFESQQTRSAAKMLLALREGHQVSQVAIGEIVSNCRTLCKQSIDYLKRSVDEVISSSGQCSHVHDMQYVLQQDFDPFTQITASKSSVWSTLAYWYIRHII